MSRSPHAAKTLIGQVRGALGRNPDSKAGLETAKAVDEPDGLGVHRAFEFDPVASRLLLKLLPSLDDDRIASYDTSGSGKNEKVTVTFVTGNKADLRTPFPLGAVEVEPESDQT